MRSKIPFVPRKIFPDYNISLSNFKGHHKKAITKLSHLSPQLDLILEVRDSRAPISTTNVLFDKILGRKKKLILYSKKDLSVLKPAVLDKWHESKLEDYMFIDCRSEQDSKKIIKRLKQMYDEMIPPPPLGMRLMIIGMPNVGKSTLVNTLREVGLAKEFAGALSTKKRKVARTGGQPGVTRATSEMIRLSRDPDVIVNDTPGVFLPTVKDPQTMLSLALVGCINDSFLDPVIVADYLLFVLNLQDPTGSKYSEYTNHPTNDIYELLHNIAKQRGTLKPDGLYDELGTANHFVNTWRQGKRRFNSKVLFDVEAIEEISAKEYKDLHKEERLRVAESNVHKVITDRFGDENSDSKHRKRNAKDRESDLKNRLFKL